MGACFQSTEPRRPGIDSFPPLSLRHRQELSCAISLCFRLSLVRKSPPALCRIWIRCFSFEENLRVASKPLSCYRSTGADLVGYYWGPKKLSIIHLYREPQSNSQRAPTPAACFPLARAAFIQSPITIPRNRQVPPVEKIFPIQTTSEDLKSYSSVSKYRHITPLIDLTSIS